MNAIYTPEDLHQARAIVLAMLGEACWKACLGYGNALILHLGERLEYGNGQKKLHYGSWSVWSRGSTWQVRTDSSTWSVSPKDDYLQITRDLNRLSSTLVSAIEIDFPSLSLKITFDNKILVEIEGVVNDEIGLPYWEVFTPEEKVLLIGPDSQWSYTSATEKLGKLSGKRRTKKRL